MNQSKKKTINYFDLLTNTEPNNNEFELFFTKKSSLCLTINTHKSVLATTSSKTNAYSYIPLLQGWHLWITRKKGQR
jgi:hypothetical protein